MPLTRRNFFENDYPRFLRDPNTTRHHTRSDSPLPSYIFHHTTYIIHLPSYIFCDGSKRKPPSKGHFVITTGTSQPVTTSQLSPVHTPAPLQKSITFCLKSSAFCHKCTTFSKKMTTFSTRFDYVFERFRLHAVQPDLQSGCAELGICNPGPLDETNGGGLQIPLLVCWGLQIPNNGCSAA